MKLIIDADPIVYRAGFASETHGYHIVFENDVGDIGEVYFAATFDKRGKKTTAGAHMKKWLKKNGDRITILSKEKVAIPEPKDHALHLVKQEITGIVRAVSDKYRVSGDRLTIVVVLSGPGNFREKLATLQPYKGNRDSTHKPYHYQAIRDYLTGHWNAQVVSGREADDECSILGWECYERDEACVIATIDKDLDQVPGVHYDYRQKVFYEMSLWNAEKAFWVQALCGDQTDNIPGCYKIGPATAEKIIDEVIDSPADQIWPTPSEFWARIVEEYALSKTRKGCTYVDIPAKDVALENARLVYMQQWPRELWVPPGEPAQWLGEGDD